MQQIRLTENIYYVGVNDRRTDLNIVDGYATIVRQWQSTDHIRLELPMQAKQVRANDNVVDNQGKLSIERGPIVYCLEGADMPDSTVFDKIIEPQAEFSAEYCPSFLSGAMILSTQGYKLNADSTLTTVSLRAIPYSMWNNRGADQMEVWIATAAQYAHITPQPTIASQAHSLIKRGAIQKDAPESMTEEWAWGVNDQWEPRNSADTSKPYHYWWLQFGKPVTISYEFDKPETISQTSVYWLDFDHYDGNFRVPESWRLYYRNRHDRWQEVSANDPYGTAKDQYNTVHFVPVTTTGLRIEAQLQKGASGGIIEWKVE